MAVLSSKYKDSELYITLEKQSVLNAYEWILGDVKLENPYFKAEICDKEQYYRAQLKQFILDIEKALSNNEGIREYEGIEPYFRLNISLNNIGNVEISG